MNTCEPLLADAAENVLRTFLSGWRGGAHKRITVIITAALANEIVARAMAIIHHNVNVIDHHGQIIASGERHRIGEQHEVAREVIRTGKRICINNAAEAARFLAMHPGINHPIIYDDRVVMVVGISGDPRR